MSNNVFTLDALREETLKKFAPFKVGLADGSEVELKSLLKLSKKSREAVNGHLKDMDAIDDSDDEDDTAENELMADSVAEIFKLITPHADKILKELYDEDPAIKLSMLSQVLNAWIGGTQLGEAQNSPA